MAHTLFMMAIASVVLLNSTLGIEEVIIITRPDLLATKRGTAFLITAQIYSILKYISWRRDNLLLYICRI